MIERPKLYVVGAVIAAGIVAWGAAAPARAADPPPDKAADTLDDELLKGLGGEKPARKPAADPQPSQPAGSDLDDELLKGLGGEKKPQPKPDAKPGEKPAAGDDPIAKVTEEMRAAQELMRRTRRDEALRPKQEEIVRQLDDLIKQIKQRQQQQQSSSSSSQQQQPQAQARQQVKQPGQPGQSPATQDAPARDSSDELRRRDPSKVDMAKMQEMLKDIWGQLPPRIREQMLQSGAEKFLPEYELLIEQYFKTLAERRGAEGP